MTLERWGDHGHNVRLIECPVCLEPLPPNKPYLVPKHISTHSPEDFGLSPIGEGVIEAISL